MGDVIFIMKNVIVDDIMIDRKNSYFMINPIWRNGYERKEAMVN